MEQKICSCSTAYPLSALDFYRLVRCRKIDRNLTLLLDFYRAKLLELQAADDNEQFNVVDIAE